jgi:formiminotetrahydrofolate cyclodeaminase
MNDFSELSIREFFAALASSAPTPGGGTAAAIAGAMGAALAEMVTGLTLSREKFAPVHDAMRSLSEAALRAREDFLVLAREDSEAYDAVLAARRLAKETDEEKQARAHAIERRAAAGVIIPRAEARVQQLSFRSWPRRETRTRLLIPESRRCCLPRLPKARS